MIKKILAFMLALAMIFSFAQLVYARPADDGWILYCKKIDENSFAAIIVAPAKYTHVSDNPQIETVFEDDAGKNTVSTPSAEQITFSSDGKAELCWALTVTCEAPNDYGIMFAVLPGSVTDGAGNGNARILFDDKTDYLEDGGYADIDVYSGLLLEDYSRDAGTVAIGDTLRVDYSGLYPVDIIINGEVAASFSGGEMQRYTCPVTETGELSVVVRQRGRDIETRSMTVITSKEMYKRNLRDGLITSEDIPRVEDLIEVGVPAGSPFIPIFIAVAILNGIRIFFLRLFSFVRITK